MAARGKENMIENGALALPNDITMIRYTTITEMIIATNICPKLSSISSDAPVSEPVTPAGS
ncbi:hypothetical protein D3C81_1491990 [compost metagenome]